MKNIIKNFVITVLFIIVAIDTIWMVYGNAIVHKVSDYLAEQALRKEIAEDIGYNDVRYSYRYVHDDGSITRIYVDTENDIVDVETFL